jgi:ubiquitin-protein ligase
MPLKIALANKFKDSTLPSSHWSQELSRLPYYYEDLLTRLEDKQNVVHFLAVKSLVLEIIFSEDYPKSPPKTSVFYKGFPVNSLSTMLENASQQFYYKQNCITNIMKYFYENRRIYLKNMDICCKDHFKTLKYVQNKPKVSFVEELENLKNQHLLEHISFEYEVEMEDNLVKFENKKHFITFEFQEDYPDSPPILEFWKTDLKEIHTEKLNEFAQQMKGKNCIFEIIYFYESNSTSFEKIVSLKKKQKMRQEDKEIRKVASELGIRSNNIREIKSELEAQKERYLDPSMFEFKKKPKKKEIPKTIQEKERQEAKNVHQATSFSFQKISVENEQKMTLERFIEILSHLKAFSSYIMMVEHQIVASKDKVISEIVKLIQYFSNESITWNAYVEEILIYSTYIALVLCNQPEAISDLMKMRVISSFWSLSKRMRGEIRHHLNCIIDKCGRVSHFRWISSNYSTNHLLVTSNLLVPTKPLFMLINSFSMSSAKVLI